MPVSVPGLWQCSICTYDNDENLLSCDICGVFRDSPGSFGNDGQEKDIFSSVSGTCKDSRASKMATSLFAGIPCRTSKTATIMDDLPRKEANKNNEKGSIQPQVDDAQRRFMALRGSNTISITPFRFDTPSPDDIVFAGKRSARAVLKDESVLSAAITDSSSSTVTKRTVKSISNDEVPDKPFGSLSDVSHLIESESSNARDSEDAPQKLASKVERLNLNKKPPNSRKAYSHAQYKPEKWMLPDPDGMLSQLNLAIAGHVDSGKSTLSGRLLHMMGRISKKEMHKYEKEAKEKGKGSFAYAWAMDESAEERERGVTMAVAVAYFDTKRYHIVLLDLPGHKDFVSSMISGATQADAAILVVDASLGSFEAGMDGNGVGQTKEHAQLLRSFGVEQLVVAVNKMDVVGFSKERFDFIKLQLGIFLRSCGFKESAATWIPLSAMENQNFLRSASDDRLSSWYQGVCLLEAIDSLEAPQRDFTKPLILPICDLTTAHSSGQMAVCGKLETGAIRNGSKVIVMPSGDLAVVRRIERDSRACSVARAGDYVAVSLQDIDMDLLMQGGVLCHPNFPVAVASRLELKILVLDITTPILMGSQFEFYTHHAKERGSVVKIISLIDQKTGKVSKRPPRLLQSKQSAVIEVVLDQAVCVEEFSSLRALGRAFLRASGRTIAVGIIIRILDSVDS